MKYHSFDALRLPGDDDTWEILGQFRDPDDSEVGELDHHICTCYSGADRDLVLTGLNMLRETGNLPDL